MWKLTAQDVKTAEARIAKLAKRATKLGIEAPTLTVGPEEAIDLEEGQVALVHPVEVSFPTIKLSGWRFVAKLEYEDSDVPVLRVRPSESLTDAERERAKTDGRACDHCHHNRRRKTTYVVRHDDGRRLQVGSSCLADFLGHDAQGMVSSLDWEREVSEALDQLGSGERGVDGFDLLTVLACTIRQIKRGGWVSRQAAQYGKVPTASVVRDVLQPSGWDREWAAEFQRSVTDTDREKAATVVEWMGTLEGSTEDYLVNLNVIQKRGYATFRTMALCCSTVAAYDRAHGIVSERKQAEANSQHVGEIKKRQDFGKCTVTFTKYLPGDMYDSTLIKFADEAGNVLVWFASGGRDVEEGETYRVKATVKAHDDYNGCAQTILTRAKLQACDE